MSSLLILSLSLLVNSITVHYQPTHKIIDPFSTLVPPPIPTPTPPSTFSVSIVNDPDTSLRLSIPQSGAFFGLSIEFSATSQLIGKNGTVIHVPFLNLLSNIAQRAGHVNVRIGGSTLDHSTFVSDLEPENSAILYADLPPLAFSTGFIYMLANISSLVPTKWYLGIPFGDSTTHHDLVVAQYSQSILGDNLAGLLVGHQPDLYALTGRRPYNYSSGDYSLEFGQLATAMHATPIADSSAVSSNNAHNKASTLLIGPNIISGASGWTPEQVWYTGFVDVHKDDLAALSVQHYATTTCHPTNTQTSFPSFLNHTSATALVTPYLPTSRIAQSAHKSLLMSETNPTSESCPDGLPGITDSFGASLWALDYALQLAHANFSGVMFHNSPGHNASSNAFRAPPPIQGSTQGWTIGPIYYSALVMAEILGPSGSSRVLDLGTTNDEISVFTPVYAVYDDDGGPSPRATKVALFNYLSGESGRVWVDLKLGAWGTTPGMVWVKYLLADSVSQKEGITWAGQTFGGFFESDGVPRGSIHIESVSCTTTTTTNNTCRIRVPAPGLALVFLTIDAIEEHLDISDAESEFAQILTGSGGTTHTLAVAEGEGAMMKTFGTTVRTEAVGPVTVTVDPAVVATSNGERRRAALGRTAPRWRSGTVKINDARRGVRAGDWMWLVGFVLGVLCSWAS